MPDQRLRIFQVDAFTDRLFAGNPAAVVPLDEWLPSETLQSVAMENNLSETAFFVRRGERYELRWFAPRREVKLCGHATLATAYVLFEILGVNAPALHFDTASGELTVTHEDSWLWMDFPADPATPIACPDALREGLGRAPMKVHAATDYLAVFDSEEFVRDFQPDVRALKNLDRRGVIVTAPGRDTDFVSRFFAPKFGIDEDPVTGSAHCTLAPFWRDRLNKTELVGRQLSPRGGLVRCVPGTERVKLGGRAVFFLAGEIVLTVD